MKRVSVTIVLLLAIIAMALPASAQGPTQIRLWRHTPDLQAELDASRANIAAFNASQSDYEVVLEELPQQSYTDSVTAAALAGDLPCIMDMDYIVISRV